MIIAHVADIHIRGLARHEEYRSVFDLLLQDIAHQQADVLVIAGDTFHSKISGLTPEYVSLFADFVKKCSSAIPLTYIVLGNHDGNLSNQTRADSVSPIVEAVNAKNVICCKRTGIYALPDNAELHVLSLFDKSPWDSIKPTPNKTCIAVYHGSVSGAETDIGWRLDTADMTLERFSGYTAVLLGDIHKRQVFERHGEPWSAYPGSLIQQNFGEETEKGYLIWRIEHNKPNRVEFRAIKNEKSFVSVNVSDDISVSQFNAQNRYRLFGKRSESAKIESIVTQLKLNGATDIIVRYEDDVISQQEIPDLSVTSSATDLINIATDLGYDVGNRKEAIVTLDEVLHDALAKIPEKKKWCLRAIRFDNILAYGKDNFVTFDEMPGIIGLFAPNNAGKSSFIGALSYVLFNESDRNRAKNSLIINRQSEHCFGRAIIDVDGDTYAIERMTCKTQKKDGSDATQTFLNVFKITNEELVDVCGEQRSDTEKILRSLIGDPDECKISSLATQGNLTRFIDDGPTPRRVALAKALELAHFEDVYKLLIDKVAVSNSQLRAISSVDYDVEIATLEHKLNTTTVAIEQLDSRRLALYDKRRFYEEDRARFEAQMHMIKRSRDLENKIKTLSAKLDIKQNRDRSDILKDLELATHVIEQRSELAKHESAVSQLKSDIQSKRRSLQVLNSVPCGGSFTTCQFIKDAVSAATQLSTCETKLSNLLAAKPQITTQINASVQDLHKEMRAAEESAVLRAERDSTLLHIEDAKKELAQLRDIVIDNPNLIQDLAKIKTELASIDNELFEHKKTTEMISAKLARLHKDRVTRDDLINKTKDMSSLASAFSKKGVPLLLLKSKLEIINSRVKALLESAVDINARAYIDGDDLQIEVQNGNTCVPIELACGAEKFFVALAFRMIMTKLSTSSADFFIIDEGFGSLDDNGLEGACKLLSLAKSMFKFIIVVSHVDYVKDVADHILEITTDETGRAAIKTKQISV
jgi:exonuclease SbcC